MDAGSGEVIAVYASRERNLAKTLTILRLEVCDGKPTIVVDRGSWYP